MNKSLVIGIVVVVLLVAGVFYFFNQPEIANADMLIEGDYDAPNLVLADGATLTVKGNLLIDKTIACTDGALTIIVTGVTTLNGKLQCNGDKGGISLVAEGGIVMAKNAVVESSGNVQFVSNEDLLLTTEEEINAKFHEIGTNSGGGVRVGPLTSAGGMNATAPAIEGSIFGNLIPVAHADGPVVISGKMSVATPPPGIKRLVIFAFPDATEVALADFELAGPDGRKGADDKAANCSAKGKDGEDAFRFTAVAPNLKVNNFTLNLGAGGAGGDAESKADCDVARAEGGKGGDSGNFKMIGSSSFSIDGAFNIHPGNGGAGGGAKAVGKDGAQNEKGGDATAIGGRGADNKKVMHMQGTVAGADNIRVGDLVAGAGGWASAQGGKGGDADQCGKNGAIGGKASATGGRGGDARLTLSGGSRMELASDIGGTGGGVDSVGGAGGAGGSCGPDKKGGNGGNGGAASATEGKGGSGKNGNASDGANLAEDGGNGGNGGDGCPEGKGGKGGAGDPEGADGADGKNLCVVEEDKPTGVVPGGGGTTSGGTSGEGSQTIQVVKYQGKYLPVDQLIIESEQGCDGGQAHWHAATGVVTATDGSKVPDPGPQCGYGKVRDNPAFDLKVQVNFRIQ